MSRPRRATTRAQQGGEILLFLGALCLLAPPAVFVLNRENTAAYERLKDEGVVARGTVTRKWIETESYTGRGGRPRVRKLHRLDVGYDFNALAPYRQWKADGRIAPAILPAPTSTQIAVSPVGFDHYAPGQRQMIVFVLGDAKSVMLVEQLEFRTSWRAHLMWAIGLAAVALVGLWLVRIGWRQRFGAASNAMA